LPAPSDEWQRSARIAQVKILAVICALVLTLLAVVVGMAKVQRLPASLHIRDSAKVPAWVWTTSGWIELVAAAGLVVGLFVAWAVALVSAAVLLISYMALAARQLSQRLPLSAATPAVVLSGLSAVTTVALIAAG
jgi:hypothetical protein